MSPTQRVAGYMQEHLDHRQQLALLNVMSAAKSGREFRISDELTPHAIRICEILMEVPVHANQPEVAA